MISDDDYQAWLNARRGQSLPAELADRIMSAVRDSAADAIASPPPVSAPATMWQRVVPYLVCSAAAMLLAMRFYSVVSVFVVAAPIADVAFLEPAKEVSHEP